MLVLLAAIHWLLGIAFSIVRMRGEARFLILAPQASLGHSRGTANMLTQGAALFAFSLPISLGQQSLPLVYYCAAALIASATLGIGLVFITRS
ncbi:hypothetical protein WM40_00130 [Robbsia andropogonis]|uniref:Uncharacterized protein n=1 Tax=Robbsia andropogonis TaxID=28092 RepID=A0A0F5K6I0_9BURK|nr:hypothetical protein WM40_00130 [Robbsia andropogonis]